ncbi:hypothetical protein PR048_001973 [Dryococelus australis]|uniref:Uncharacterized protein n=1 Tax=Dryococelus australis TaxID=614101 RepID=A0ABQ9IIT8_9NEOP|nr:hypothetical protein PR048_001973 [Dryococelus australis]
MLLEEKKKTSDVSLSSQSPADVDFKNYLDEPLTPDEDVFQNWETAPYPILKRLASKYLCVPAVTYLYRHHIGRSVLTVLADRCIGKICGSAPLY